MRVCEGLEVLDLQMSPEHSVHPTVVWDDDDMVLIDAGAPVETIERCLAEAGLDIMRLGTVLVTHQDMDHIGGLAGLKEAHGVRVYAHEAEVPHIQGERPNIKMTPEKLAALKEMMKGMPEEQRRVAMAIRAGGRVGVDTVLYGGEVLPFCGGIECIHVPGHTPGHACYYLRAHKTLVAGDSMNVKNGALIGPYPEHTYDMPTARASLAKLLAYDIERIICHHGGLYHGNAMKVIRELAAD